MSSNSQSNDPTRGCVEAPFSRHFSAPKRKQEKEEGDAHEKMAQQLSGVLKLRQKEKIEFFDCIATARDGSLLATLKMEKESDRASVAQLVKLVAGEQKKSRFDHVTTIVRGIRWCLIDQEKAMREMVSVGLDKVILASITKLRQEASKAGRSGHSPLLQSLLASASYMFEWEFFADGYYPRFLDEMLAILTTCNDCDDNLFGEAACVLMAMCSTNVSAVCECLMKRKKALDLLKKVFNELPRSKSFFYQALLVELSYRLSRYSLKMKDPKISRVCCPLMAALPVHLGRSLVDIRPKTFREETRLLLNEFNLIVGVIKTHELVKLECEGSSRHPITLTPAGWIDLGGTSLEIEFSAHVKSRNENGTLKLPYKAVKGINLDKRTSRVTITVHDNIPLAELAEGINDSEWAAEKRLCLLLFVKSEALSLVVEHLSQLVFPCKVQDSIQVETKLIKREVLEGVTSLNKHQDIDSTFAQRGEESATTNHGAKRRFHCETKADSVVDGLRPPLNVVHIKENQPGQSDERRRGSEHVIKAQRDMALNSCVTRTRILSNIHDDATRSNQHRNLVKQKRTSPGHHADQINSYLLDCKNQEHNSDKKNTQEKNTEPSVPKKTSFRVHEVVTHVKDDEDRHRVSTSPPPRYKLSKSLGQMGDVSNEEVTPDWSNKDKHSFRAVQTEQLHKLQGLVEEIAEANNQFRLVNMARLCHNVSAESAAVLSKRGQHLIDDEVFASVIDSAHANQVKRGDNMASSQRLRATFEDVLLKTSEAEATVTKGVARIITSIEKRVQHDWKHDLDRAHKKLRSDTSQRVSSAKAKLAAIEKAFSTDDLLVMQRMMQRI